MSAAAIVVDLMVVALLLLAAALLLGMCRNAARGDRATPPPLQQVWDDAREEWILLPPGDEPGPGQFTPEQVAEIDGLTVALAAPAFDPATDPQWAAARARLLNDLNNPTGDQT